MEQSHRTMFDLQPKNRRKENMDDLFSVKNKRALNASDVLFTIPRLFKKQATRIQEYLPCYSALVGIEYW